MRLLYLDWPHLPLQLALERAPEGDEVVVLGGRPWDPGDVLDRSPAAGALGVRRGQPLGTAHSLVPEATFLPLDVAALADSFEAALECTEHPGAGRGRRGRPGRSRLRAGLSSASRGWPAVGRGAGAGRPGPGPRGTAAAGAATCRHRQHPLRGGGGRPHRCRRGPTRRAAGGGGLPGTAADRAAAGGWRYPGAPARVRADHDGELAALDHSAVVARFGAPGG